MPNHKLHWISAASLILGLAVTGCAKDDEGDDGNADTGGDSSGDESGTASATASMSGTSASTTMGGTSATSTTDPSESDTDTDSSTITVTTTEGPVEPQPNGESCTVNEECVSEMCFVVGPLGGICGDCLSDADCADTTGGGCSIPNPLGVPPEGAACNMGEPGEGCMTDDVCSGEQVCAEILNVPGILVASTCSECIDDAGCTDNGLCSPSYDVANLSGVKACVQPGDVPDGEGCDLEGSGNEACDSGNCVGADVLNVLLLGVCNPCGEDADCDAGEMCAPPTVDLMEGLVVGGCVPME